MSIKSIAHNPPPRLLLPTLTLATVAAEMALVVAMLLAIR